MDIRKIFQTGSSIRSGPIFGLRSRIVAAAILSMLPIGAIMAWSVHEKYGHDRKHALEETFQKAVVIAARIQDTMDATQRGIASLSILAPVADRVYPQCRELLAAYVKRVPWVTAAWATDAAGTVECGDDEALAVDRSDRRDFVEAVRTGKFAVGTYRVGAISGKPVIPVTYPILKPDGTVHATVGTSISVAFADPIVEDVLLSHDMEVMLVSGDRRILFRRTNLSGESGRYLDEPDLVPALADRKLRQIETRESDGTLRVYGVAHLRSAEIAVFVGVSEHATGSSATKSVLLFAFAVFLTILSAVGLTTLSMERLVMRPIRTITEAAAGIAAGKRGTRIAPLGFCGDFERLAATFDDMSARIEHREQTIIAADARLRDAINTMPMAFAIWDAADRLVMVNETITRSHSETGHSLVFVPGKTFAEVMRDAMETGLLRIDESKREAYLAHRIALHRNAAGTAFETRSSDGRYYETREHRMRDNGIVTIRMDVTERKREERARELERDVLELVSRDRPIASILDELCLAFERESTNIRCAIMLIDSSGRSLYAASAPSLPEDYGKAIGKIEIGPSAGACGAAAFHAKPVIVEDIARDPLWANGRPFAAAHGLQSCWSTPLFAIDGKVLGTFAIYGNEPRRPDDREMDIATHLAKLAALAVERSAAQFALRRSEQRLKSTLDNTIDGLLTIDENLIVKSFNAPAQRIFGYDADEVVGRPVLELLAEQFRAADDNVIARHIAGGRPMERGIGCEIMGRRRDGTTFPLDLYLAEVPADDGNRKFVATIRDISHVKATEARLRQAQRLEAVGQLTGGVAHDFNNLLAIILGNLEALADPKTTVSERDECLEAAVRATRWGAELTQRLLAFSRRQTLNPGLVDVNGLIRGMAALLDRTLGETISTEIHLDAGVGAVHADAAQLESAILNLAVNARDAMPDGGRIEIGTSVVDAASIDLPQDEGLAPGRYVQISLSDTGAGMAPEILARAFEPFFTTKEFGRGSGLGLSMVYGFAAQSAGRVLIRSQIGVGTTVVIVLPRRDSAGGDAG